MAVPSNLFPGTGTRIPSLDQPRLCRPCKEALISARGNWWHRFKFFVNWNSWSPPDSYKSTYHINRLSLDDNCFLCWRIARQDKSLWKLSKNENTQTTLDLTIGWGPKNNGYNQTVGLFALFLGTPGNCLVIESLSAQDACSKGKVDTTNIPSETWSPEAVGLAGKWLDDCLNQHFSCSRTLGQAHTRYVPKRIIKVEKDTTQGLRARLLLRTSAPPDLQYLTLSHCWGGLKFLTLTMDHVDSFSQQIPVSDERFNKTFRDAFKVTLDLGYEYIWIDSLCIIQDSPGASDWNDECPQVGSIYANGVCNLSATGFKNGATGMFNKRNVNITAPCPIKFPFRPLKYLVTNVLPFDGPETEYPLLSRAWVLQEHALSPRTLYFLPTQICWTCRNTNAYELDVLPERKMIDELHIDLQRFKSMFATNPFITGNPHDHWRIFVERASRTHLTFSSDKLSCLSGIASLLQPSLRTRYVAGHWESNLLESLTWYCDLKAEETMYAGYIAPSWSWVSAWWPVKYLDMGSPFTLLSQVVEVNVTHTGTDKFGALSGAYLRMRGPVVEGITEIDKSPLRPDDSYYGTITGHGDMRIRIKVRPDRKNSVPLEPGQTHKRQTGALSGEPLLSLSRTHRCLPLAFEGNKGIFGLVVQQVESRSGGAFKRVGMFLAFRWLKSDLPSPVLLSAFSNLPVEEYRII